MAYDEKVVRAARARLEKRRRDAETAAAALRERMCARIPRLREIEREMSSAIPELTHAILVGNVDGEVDRIQTKNLQLQREMADLLRSAGCDCDSFAPRYTCAVCSDTGYAGGAVCACYRHLLQEEACRSLTGLSAAKVTDFDSMRLDYYDNTVDPKLGVSPRRHMQDVITYCRDYTAAFDVHSDSLLLWGATGIGKTHLCLAIARGVTEQGFGVVYGSVQPLIRRLEAERFGREQGDSENQLISCDLLVLDDLGMEFDTPFSRACLYDILNARVLEGKPTVVSTNLSLSAMKERYGDQIASRISGGFVPLLCVGNDIRQIIRRQSLNE
ncbi:MAG: ATP-binding protein [Clostridia bacterium]|nr:ATP-binding protein [Clostridia bacterium]